MLLSNKADTTKEIMDKVKVIFENLPFFLKPGIIKNDVMNMKFDNGVKFHSQATSKRASIGFTIHWHNKWLLIVILIEKSHELLETL